MLKEKGEVVPESKMEGIVSGWLYSQQEAGRQLFEVIPPVRLVPSLGMGVFYKLCKKRYVEFIPIAEMKLS